MSKILNILFYTYTCFGWNYLLFMQLFLKIPIVMANSVDPDQTASRAVWSGSALFAYAIWILSETLVHKILGHLPYYGKAGKKNWQICHLE